MTYQYSIDHYVNNNKLDPMIIHGAPATAFINCLPEVVLDLSTVVDQGSPLVYSALECELTSCFMLPVFYLSPISNSCVGVIECSMKGCGSSCDFQ